MTYKRRLLSALTRADLLLLGRAFELQVSPRMSLDELQGELSRSKRATLDKILPELPDQAIERIRLALGLPAEGASEQVVSVPTQVVEIVRPGRAVDRGDSLLNTEARAAAARTDDALPPNRLIWTNDNLVALQTLLDERDPGTRDYRYRGDKFRFNPIHEIILGYGVSERTYFAPLTVPHDPDYVRSHCKSKGEVEPLVFTTEFKYAEPGRYRVAARVTDVFGNDGIAAVEVEVK